MDDASEYKEMFLSELSENISLLNSSLLEIEKDPSNAENISEVVRAAHTVKGMAGMMGYDTLATLTHAMEDHLMEMSRLTKDLIQTLFKATDRMQEFHDVVAKDGDPSKIKVDDIINELGQGGGYTVEDTSELGELRLGTTYSLTIKFNAKTQLLGARGFQAYRVIDSIAQINQSDPPVDVLENGKLIGDITMEIITYESEAAIRNNLSNVEDISEIVISKLIDDTPVVQRDLKTRRAIQSVRVNLNKLDQVIDLLGELVITRGRFQSLVDRVTPEISEQFQIFDNTINTIQDEVMSLRMVNLTRIFDTFPRAVRDIASGRSMEIDLILQGTHIQLDRSVVDQVHEALLHLVRNAAIHGIEDEKDRKSAGKSVKGRIRLSAKRERGEVVFEVEDDGQGLDIDNIRTRAIEKGYIRSDQTMTRAQVAALIFRPGFSTAKELTEIAGRGVGMDIVKSTVDEISGTIEIRTKKGTGTRFIIRVPQTLAIIDALIVELQESDDYQYAIPILNVEKIFSLNDPVIRIHEGKSYLDYEGHTVRIVNLENRMRELGIISQGTEKTPSSRRRKSRDKIILWERAGQRIALQVSRVLEQREIVTKDLGDQERHTVGFIGATILGYDKVALIIDPDNIERQFI
ncbi:MAG: ATP-binding protein [Candidatus Kariarchaeaceae archaeon]|jgi:two-component system chemotaxis sensor kinase CheA